MELYEEEEDSTLAMEEKCYKALGRHRKYCCTAYFLLIADIHDSVTRFSYILNLFLVLTSLAGLPKMLYFGEFNEGKGNILVLELVGPSLMDILEQKQLDVFSLKTVLLLGIQIVSIVKLLHYLAQCVESKNKKTISIPAVPNGIHTQ